MKNIDKTRNYSIEQKNQSKLMSRKQKNVCRILNYIDHLLILVSKVTGCVSISDFAYSLDVHIGITSSAVELNLCNSCGD